MKYKRLKIFLVILLYIFLIIFQLGAFTPYVETETYISSQNVPHTIVVDRGFTNIDAAQRKYVYEKGKRDRRDIDYPLAFMQFFLTTGIAVLLLIYIQRKSKNTKEQEFITEIETLQKQIQDLEITIQNSRILQSIQNGCDNLPTFDVNALAFADEDTQERELEIYRKSIEQHTINKLVRDFLSYSIKENTLGNIIQKQYNAMVLDFEKHKVYEKIFTENLLPANFSELLDEKGTLYIKRILRDGKYIYVQIDKNTFSNLIVQDFNNSAAVQNKS